mmetsp:Transcript_13842/g.51876  ORF Transcript_13842/g.51876 Transcript_13842/m.51876 type:complete len:202 (-) Transcript_13842:1348-1953(-)
MRFTETLYDTATAYWESFSSFSSSSSSFLSLSCASSANKTRSSSSDVGNSARSSTHRAAACPSAAVSTAFRSGSAGFSFARRSATATDDSPPVSPAVFRDTTCSHFAGPHNPHGSSPTHTNVLCPMCGTSQSRSFVNAASLECITRKQPNKCAACAIPPGLTASGAATARALHITPSRAMAPCTSPAVTYRSSSSTSCTSV